ncbi:hypothetical protein N665_0541s0012 [Sinapis alba]|nr:hypothetical protein N665_0541s0012 [Sinapis alba]
MHVYARNHLHDPDDMAWLLDLNRRVVFFVINEAAKTAVSFRMRTRVRWLCFGFHVSGMTFAGMADSGFQCCVSGSTGPFCDLKH